MPKEWMITLVAAAKQSCRDLRAFEPQAVLAPALKWVDVADDLLLGDEERFREDVGVIILEPLKMLAEACAARLTACGRSPRTDSTAAELVKKTMQGDVLERRRAYVAYVNELLAALEAVSEHRYPRLQEWKPPKTTKEA